MSNHLPQFAAVAFLPVGPLFARSVFDVPTATIVFTIALALTSTAAVLLALSRVHARISAAQRLAMTALMDTEPPEVGQRRLRSVQ